MTAADAMLKSPECMLKPKNGLDRQSYLSLSNPQIEPEVINAS